ncbi:zf-HC2 domain-containing protein [Moorella naiadis]|uniref:zf-HC2 domain-containing protein n=1 Tax=Moorella naiadis (nom. illeg.) TaxID=3093670 RepID=UPI003D9CA087
MECREAREFFSPYLDEELAREERAALEGHLEGCPACREELARWRELARALRGLKVAAAPPGFTAAVLARVAGLERAAAANAAAAGKPFPGLIPAGSAAGVKGEGMVARKTQVPDQEHTGLARPRAWRGMRPWVAAAAAVAMLAAGSISYAARGFWQQLPGSIVTAIHQGPDQGGRQVAVTPGGEPSAPGTPVPGNDASATPGAGGSANPGSQAGAGTTPTPGSPPAGTGGQPGGANTAPGNGDAATGKQPGASGNTNNTPGATGEQPGNSGNRQPTRVAANEPYPARSFLSTGRQVTSTMLKVSVADIAAARSQALGLAGSSGAGVQIIADQDNGGEKRFICQFTLPENRAASLLAGLAGLGQVTYRNTSTQDLTQQFSATLDQYQAKVAQVNAASDPAAKEKLQGEAQALERQLSTWEQETKQQTIILWLETK